MKRFVEGECRDQSVLFPERLDDWIAEDNPVRAVDAFVEELDFSALGFEGAEPADTGRPAYHPGTPPWRSPNFPDPSFRCDDEPGGVSCRRGRKRDAEPIARSSSSKL